MDHPASQVDFVEAGAGQGPLVVLIHSSSAGARQWRRLLGDLEDRFHLRAINLFGYGGTPAWARPRSQRLQDQAGLVAAALPDTETRVSLIGHSFGGAVAMQAARELGPRVDKLVLLEPNPFRLLDRHGRPEAFAEIFGLCTATRRDAVAGDWTTAAERFADYWSGQGTWAALPEERRAAFVEALKPNLHEWDAVMDDETSLDDWAGALPDETLVVTARDTTRPIREIAQLLRGACPAWRFEEIGHGGHMAPVTRPDLINPLIAAFLDRR